MNRLSDIERGVIDRLKSKGLSVNLFEIKKDTDIVRMTPAVRSVIADGKFTPIGQISYRVDVNLYVIVIFKNLSDEESRRKGVYPILKGVLSILGGQDLGLKIDELTPVSFREITNDRDEESGLIVFQVVLTTRFSIEKVSDEQAADLITIGINYYLDPAKAADPDAVPDAHDQGAPT